LIVHSLRRDERALVYSYLNLICSVLF